MLNPHSKKRQRCNVVKKSISFKFPEELITRLKEQAVIENRSFSNLVETALLRYVETMEAEEERQK